MIDIRQVQKCYSERLADMMAELVGMGLDTRLTIHTYFGDLTIKPLDIDKHLKNIETDDIESALARFAPICACASENPYAEPTHIYAENQMKAMYIEGFERGIKLGRSIERTRMGAQIKQALDKLEEKA